MEQETPPPTHAIGRGGSFKTNGGIFYDANENHYRFRENQATNGFTHSLFIWDLILNRKLHYISFKCEVNSEINNLKVECCCF